MPQNDEVGMVIVKPGELLPVEIEETGTEFIGSDVTGVDNEFNPDGATRACNVLLLVLDRCLAVISEEEGLMEE